MLYKNKLKIIGIDKKPIDRIQGVLFKSISGEEIITYEYNSLNDELICSICEFNRNDKDCRVNLCDAFDRLDSNYVCFLKNDIVKSAKNLSDNK